MGAFIIGMTVWVSLAAALMGVGYIIYHFSYMALSNRRILKANERFNKVHNELVLQITRADAMSAGIASMATGTWDTGPILRASREESIGAFRYPVNPILIAWRMRATAVPDVTDVPHARRILLILDYKIVPNPDIANLITSASARDRAHARRVLNHWLGVYDTDA